MKEHETKAAARVRADGLGDIAKQGVERALAARGAVVLSEEQAQQIGGGAAVSVKLMAPIIAGGRVGPIDIFTGLGGGVTVPKTLGAGGAATLGA